MHRGIGRDTEIGLEQPLGGTGLQRRQRQDVGLGEPLPPACDGRPDQHLRATDSKQQDRARSPACDVQQPLEHGDGRPVQVVHDQHQGAFTGQGREQGRHRLAHPVTAHGPSRHTGLPPGGDGVGQAQQGLEVIGDRRADHAAVDRMAEPGDGALDLTAGGVDVVLLGDPARRAHHLHHRGQVAPGAVGCAPAPQHPGAGQLAGEARELLREPGLADAGLPADDDPPGAAAVHHVQQSPDQLAELGVAADERCLDADTEPAGRTHVQTGQLEGLHRITLAAQAQRRQGPPGGHRHRGLRGGPTGEHVSHPGGVGQPRRRVDRVPDDGVGQRRLQSGHHLPGVEPDPQAQPATAAALLLHQAPHGCLHRCRGPHRALGVVLVRGGRTEDRHDPVAGELVDVTAVGEHDARQVGQHPVGHRTDLLGVEILGPAGELRQVTEQDRDHPAVGLHRWGAGRVEGRAAREAEPGAVQRRGGADRTRHGWRR